MAQSKQRARRTARAVLHGKEIHEIVNSAEVRPELVAAAEAGHPPVAAVSKFLEAVISLSDLKLTPVKQYIGLCVRAVLEEEGFEVEATGVRLSNDPIFRTGSVYRRVTENNAEYALMRKVIGCLSDQEAAAVFNILLERGLKVNSTSNENKPASHTKRRNKT